MVHGTGLRHVSTIYAGFNRREGVMTQHIWRVAIIAIISAILGLQLARIVEYYADKNPRALESSGYWDRINRGASMYDGTGDRSIDTED
jgi:hypothetical protein